MKVMILAAGRGTRLGPLGLHVPKALVDLDGEPLLARQLRYLAREGATHVVVNAHHLGEQVHAFASTYQGPLEVAVIEEPELLGTAGGVRNALPLLQGGPFAVLYGDVLFDEPLGPLFEAHQRSGAVATLACYAADTTVDKGVVEVDADDRIVAFREKTGGGGPGLVNAGLYVLEQSVAEDLRPGVALDFGFDVFPSLLAAGRPLRVHRLPAPVTDIGTPEALEHVRLLLTGAP